MTTLFSFLVALRGRKGGREIDLELIIDCCSTKQREIPGHEIGKRDAARNSWNRKQKKIRYRATMATKGENEHEIENLLGNVERVTLSTEKGKDSPPSLALPSELIK